jgi:hypothetical protein
MLLPYPSASVVHRDGRGARDPCRDAPTAALARAVVLAYETGLVTPDVPV